MLYFFIGLAIVALLGVAILAKKLRDANNKNYVLEHDNENYQSDIQILTRDVEHLEALLENQEWDLYAATLSRDYALRNLEQVLQHDDSPVTGKRAARPAREVAVS